MRASGILLSVSSLPSRYGIGGFTQEAYDWIDFMKKSGQTLWQILPLGHTSYGNSPYQTFSTIAGNPYFVSLDELIEEGILTREECDGTEFGTDPTHIDYGLQYQNRIPLLRKAWERDAGKDQSGFLKFREEEADWLADYALFMALKDLHEMKPWYEWEQPYKMRDPETIEQAKRDLKDDISFYEHVQYWFYTQWNRLKNYADEQGVRIVGDLPIYVALDSVDVWANPRLFQLDEDLTPTAVAGVPPDYFSETGQLWGNPLYDWDYHRETGFIWWTERVRHAAKLYDVMRFDHFRGLDAYCSIPYGDETAKNGKWVPGPGIALIRAIQEKVPELEIIAEDLGVVTESVKELLAQSGFPGMKVLQFAFDSDSGNDFLPHNYTTTNCVAYTGTHDNATLFQFLCEIDGERKERIKNYMNRFWDTDEQLCDNMIRLGMLSIAKYCIIPMQDYLHIGAEGRMNFPSVSDGNWEWRLTGDRITEDLSGFIGNIARVSGRWPETEEEKPENEEAEAEKAGQQA